MATGGGSKANANVSSAVIDHLKRMRYGSSEHDAPRKKRAKLEVEPGRSISFEEIASTSTAGTGTNNQPVTSASTSRGTDIPKSVSRPRRGTASRKCSLPESDVESLSDIEPDSSCSSDDDDDEQDPVDPGPTVTSTPKTAINDKQGGCLTVNTFYKRSAKKPSTACASVSKPSSNTADRPLVSGKCKGNRAGTGTRIGAGKKRTVCIPSRFRVKVVYW